MVVQIRWMIRRDMPEVLDIENQCFEFAWTEEDFLCCLRQRNCIGMVAEYQEQVIGYMIYELHKQHLFVANFAVHPACQRQGVGTQMIDKLKCKLCQQRRTMISMYVREHNLPMQLTLKANGFRCVGTERGVFEPDHEDAMKFKFNLRDVDQPFAESNRVAEYLRHDRNK